jgi:hypothetical protein
MCVTRPWAATRKDGVDRPDEATAPRLSASLSLASLGIHARPISETLYVWLPTDV